MSGKEKLYFLLNRIDDVRAIAPSGQPLIIDPTNDLNQNYREVELSQLFTKLEKDEQVLKVLKVPGRIKTIDFVEGIIPDEPIPENDDGCWHIKLLSAFDGYYLKTQYEPEYQKFSPSRTQVKQPEPEKQNSVTESGIVYEVTYTQAREVLINDLFQLAKPNFDNENDLVFQFLYDNPNKKWTLKEIQEKVSSITKTLHKIVENLGFVGDFKKVFFDVSETAICFKNPITKGELEKLGIKQIKLPR